MELIAAIVNLFIKAFEIFLHLDRYLGLLIQSYGSGIYLILFAVIFAETGFVITPFLPGDSALFAVGAFCAMDYMDIKTIWPLLIFASISGDNINYFIGKNLGEKLIQKNRLLKKEHLEKTHNFYEKYGAKTLILAKYVPIVRTFAPFVAGLGKMTYKKFFSLNIIAGFSWISILLWSGFLFGNVPLVKNNFSIVIAAIIAVSILPAFIELYRAKKNQVKLNNR